MRSLSIGLEKNFAGEYFKGLSDGYKEGLADAPNKGASSWNDLTDKPFYQYEEEYEETVTEEMTIEWDGVVGDRLTALEPDGTTWVYISDAIIPNLESTIGCVLGVIYEGQYQEMAVPSDQIHEKGSTIFMPYVTSASEDSTGSTTYGAILPKKGLYFCMGTNGLYPSKFTCTLTQTVSGTRTVIKKIDEKYLPEGIGYEKVGQVIEWDGTIGDRPFIDLGNGMVMVCISDIVITDMAELYGVKYIGTDSTTGNTSDCSPNEDNSIVEQGPGNICAMGWCNNPEAYMPVYFFSIEGELEPGMIIPQKGVYAPMSPVYVSKITLPTKVKSIEEKYLPKTVTENVVSSTTEGSLKKFKLKVDDSGTITAQDITKYVLQNQVIEGTFKFGNGRRLFNQGVTYYAIVDGVKSDPLLYDGTSDVMFTGNGVALRYFYTQDNGGMWLWQDMNGGSPTVSVCTYEI